MTKSSLKYLKANDPQKIIDTGREIINSERFIETLKQILTSPQVQESLENQKLQALSNGQLSEFSLTIQSSLLEILDDKIGALQYLEKTMEFKPLGDISLKDIGKAKSFKNAVKKAIGTITDNENKVSRIQGSIMEVVSMAIEQVSFELGKTVITENRFIDNWYTMYGKLTFLETEKERKKFAYTFRYFYKNILNRIIRNIEKFDLKNMHPTYKPSQIKAINNQVKKDLIGGLKELTISHKNLKEEEYDQFQQDLLTTLSIFRDIFANKNIFIYLSTYNNYKDIFGQIFSCISEKKVEFQILTCPDYSGETIEGVFNYNFKCLNDGLGCVGEKSIDLVTNIVKIFRKYLPNDKIKVNHYLPSFEFNQEIGFEGENEKLSYQECVLKLKGTARKIQKIYKKEQINCHVGISFESISDEELERRKKIKIEDLKRYYNEHKEFQKLVIGIFNDRSQLYYKWYPKLKNENDESYNARLKDIVLGQIAEYICIAENFSIGEDHFMLASDSRVMYNAYAYMGFPILYGQGKTTNDYAGA